MAILTRDKIIEEINKKRIKIKPFDPKNLGPASYDLHLGKYLRIFKDVRSVFEIIEEIDYEKVTQVVKLERDYLLMPGQTIHGITLEKIILPGNICGWIQGRSRFSRIGLMVHITSSFIQPGTCAKQVLEMNNAGPMPLLLRPGIAICQMIFEECKGEAVYRGRFYIQDKP